MMHDCSLEFPARTEETHVKHLEEALSKPTTAQQEAAAKEHGIHLVENGLHGFAHSNTFGSSNQLFGVETMHVMDLGVGLYLVDYAVKFLESRNKKHLVLELNRRMHDPPRSEDTPIPVGDGTYFSDHCRVQAREHRSMVQINPHIFNGIDDDYQELVSL